ncbi:vancomycin high temperature exclusion protein [Mariniflexile sp. HNIBRBA6329]|uniref:SanA/YdcF family protein n=1 Tax=Mariniflexile sp. HNIBRBA6329 TaxID=3373088 RepID=UPI00374746D6
MKVLKTLLFLFVMVFIVLIGSNYCVCNNAKGNIYNSTSVIPKSKVGLLLGTSKYTSNNNINLYYKFRVEAAVKLFKAKKIEFILVSGDNSKIGYDEPEDLKKDLILAGIPQDKIFLDYAGFRTLDSVIRAKEIFGLTEFTVISQNFHNERAIYLAESVDIKAIAFNAEDVKSRYGFKIQCREYFAKTKACLDVLFDVQPKFLGKKIEIK